jgi:hypothetical protein
MDHKCIAGIIVVLATAAASASAQDRERPVRWFAGAAALASVQPEGFATRRDLRGAAQETKAGGLVFGGVMLPHRLAVQAEVSATGRLERRERDDGRDEFVDMRDGLGSVLLAWRAASVGPVAIEPLGGLSFAFARDRRNRIRDEDRRDRNDTDTVTRGGVVAGADLRVSVSRHISIVPAVRVHRLARRDHRDEDTPDLRDGANVYRFGIGARWTF